MYLVLEYMKKGDLINVLKDREASSLSANGQCALTGVQGSSLSDVELWNIFRQVVAGIRYLHYQNVVHGDIKPQVIAAADITSISDKYQFSPFIF